MFGNVKRIAVSDLRAGFVCATDVCDDSGRVLLAAGTKLTSHFIQRLRDRGVRNLSIGAEDHAELAEPRVSPSAPSQSSPKPRRNQRIDRRQEPYSRERAVRFQGQLGQSLSLLDEIASDGMNMTSAAMQELASIPNSLVEMVLEDTDQAILATKQESLNRLSARMAQMSVLASGLAIELDLLPAEVSLVGQAAILHDVGLFMLPSEVRDHTRWLTEEELDIYRGHPRLSVEMLSDCYGISDAVKLLVMQVHELGDGTGFPRRLARHRQHPLTRILSLVEVYLSLTAPGPDRLALIPHDAIRVMLHQCRSGVLDSDTLRAFLNQHSLFPLGSRIELDDATEMVTARRDGEAYDRPIVTPTGSDGDELIPLAASQRKIVRPVYDFGCEMRLPTTAAATMDLNAFMHC